MSKGNARVSARVPARAAGRPHPAVVAIPTLFVLAGCAPDLGEAPRVQPPTAYADAKSFAAPKVDWPSDAWWKAYGDPQLDQLIDEALADSPDLKAAAARARGAAAMAEVAGANLWPTVAGTASVTKTEESLNQGFPAAFQSYLPHGWHTAGQIAAGFDYQLDFFGKNCATLAAATSEADAAAAEQAEARLQISAAVAETYANLVQLFADQRAARDAVRVRRESAALVESRSKSNLENEGAVSLARGQLHAAELESDALDRLIALTRDQLAALLGKGPDRGLADRPAGDRKDPQPRTAGFALGRSDRAASGHRRGAPGRRGGGLPHRGRQRQFLSQRRSDRRVRPAVAGHPIPAAAPVADGPVRTGDPSADLRLRPQRGRLPRRARANTTPPSPSTTGRWPTPCATSPTPTPHRRGVAVEIKDARAALAESENGYRVIKQRYDAGLSRYTDVLTAENALLAQRRAVADLQAQAFAADVALARALGGGYAAKS